jgi:hypothetical protein
VKRAVKILVFRLPPGAAATLAMEHSMKKKVKQRYGKKKRRKQS